MSMPGWQSERAQEHQESLLLFLRQLREPAFRIGRLAAVAENGVPQGQRLPVVHEPTASAQTPERRRPKPAGGELVARLHVRVGPSVVLEHGEGDAITGPDVVKEEVAVGMKHLV